jgi:hypothetical protein
MPKIGSAGASSASRDSSRSALLVASAARTARVIRCFSSSVPASRASARRAKSRSAAICRSSASREASSNRPAFA